MRRYLPLAMLLLASFANSQPNFLNLPKTTVSDTILDLSCQPLVGTVTARYASSAVAFAQSIATTSGVFTMSLYPGAYNVKIHSSTFGMDREEIWSVPQSGTTQTLANVGSPSANIMCSGSGGGGTPGGSPGQYQVNVGGAFAGGSVQQDPTTGQVLVVKGFATKVCVVSGTSPVFDLASCNSFEFSIGGNSTSSLSNPKAGQEFKVSVTQGGGFTLAWPGGTSNSCTISPTAGVTTIQNFKVNSDGVTVVGSGCSTTEGVFRGPTTTAPATPGAGLVCWFDTGGATYKCLDSGGNIHSAVLSASGNPSNQTLLFIDTNGAQQFGTVSEATVSGLTTDLGSKAPTIPLFNNQTGTTYTLQSSDLGKIVTLDNAAAITLTVPAGLSVGINSLIVQLGAGQVTIAQSGTTLNSRSGSLSLSGQFAMATIVSTATNVFDISGDLQVSGGSTGNAASIVTATFGATPTFTCPSSTADTITNFKMSTTLSTSITSSTLVGCTPGQILNFVFTQNGTGGFDVAMPTGFSQACAVGKTANTTTTMSFWWDGSTAQKLSCNVDGGPNYTGPEVTAPTAPPDSGSEDCFFDAATHRGWECMAPGSTNLFLMMPASVAGFLANVTSDVQVQLDAKAPLGAVQNLQTGTSYTLQISDKGKSLAFNNAAAITLTVPSGLGSDFSCLIVQLGAGQVTPTASSTTINVAGGTATKTHQQFSVATLLATASNVFVLSGDLQ